MLAPTHDSARRRCLVSRRIDIDNVFR
jgi:hypothetical protein